MISMKVHQLARGLWAEAHEAVPSLTLGCKRLRPLAPKLVPASPASDTTSSSTTTSSPPNNNSLDLKTFIRPDCGPRRLGTSSNDANKKDSPQVETHPGGTRWNPTQEQIGILETLYRGGMRTPNAQQIEHITSQLSKFGKIEGKNVFYWFQNHKARERQKHKRNTLALATTPPPFPTAFNPPTGGMERDREDSTSPYKRKCMRWGFDCLVEDNVNNKNNNISSCNILYNYDQDRDQLLGSRTLELFPLHPEGR